MYLRRSFGARARVFMCVSAAVTCRASLARVFSFPGALRFVSIPTVVRVAGTHTCRCHCLRFVPLRYQSTANINLISHSFSISSRPFRRSSFRLTDYARPDARRNSFPHDVDTRDAFTQGNVQQHVRTS